MKKSDGKLLDKIIESLEKGNGIKETCKNVGVHFSTYYDWIDPNSPRFDSDFSDRIKKAKSIGEITIKETCEEIIMKAATDKTKPVWQAAAWMLERKFRNEYGKSQQLDHNILEKERAYIDDLFPPDEEMMEAAKQMENLKKNTN